MPQSPHSQHFKIAILEIKCTEPGPYQLCNFTREIMKREKNEPFRAKIKE